MKNKCKYMRVFSDTNVVHLAEALTVQFGCFEFRELSSAETGRSSGSYVCAFYCVLVIFACVGVSVCVRCAFF